MSARRKPLQVLLAALLTTFAAASAAAAMTVQPVVIDLTTSGRGMTQVVTVENTFDRPLPVELRMEGLELTPQGVQASGSDNGELAVFPPQALIQPGQRQSFRVQYVGDPALTQSRHYYVTAAQLPVQMPEGGSNIQLLYNFQVLVSVSPEAARPELSIQSAQAGRDEQGRPAAVITVSNASAAHGYLSRGRLRIIQRDDAGAVVFDQQLSGPDIQQAVGYGLIGGKQTREVAIPVPLPQTGGRVEVQFVPEK